MECITELNGTDVLVIYSIDVDYVPTYDHATGWEGEEEVATFTVERVMYRGVDVMEILSESDVTALAMACEHEHEVEVEA
jgi:hypothetical protein